MWEGSGIGFLFAGPWFQTTCSPARPSWIHRILPALVLRAGRRIHVP